MFNPITGKQIELFTPRRNYAALWTVIVVLLCVIGWLVYRQQSLVFVEELISRPHAEDTPEACAWWEKYDWPHRQCVPDCVQGTKYSEAAGACR
jgi:hypothetical protein